ncbi:MAG: trypsin-like peptidase domain-containing protein [Patescibacteria group bacterium]
MNNSTRKFKEMFKDPVVRTVVVSFLTIVVTLGLIFGAAWYYRGKIFQLLATNYEINQKNSSSNLVFDPRSKEETSSSNGAPLVQAKEDNVVNAVKRAKPAVVSIIISKEVPKYDVSYDQGGDPFGGMFPGFFFQTPTYKQNGTEKKQLGSGSGFLISSDGMIVTNKHVVADSDAIYEVLLNNGKKYTAKVLARDGVLDVAIVKISASDLPYLNLADSDTLDVGESVIAIGNALGEFKNTVSVGVVSGLSRSVVAGNGMGQSERLDKVIQTDAAINPGNSGGPLLNIHGDVIGINVAVVQGSSNVGFALPINSVKSAINSVKSSGKIVRPYVGIRYINVTAELKAKNNLTVDYGVLVQRGATTTDLAVVPGSPADKAGIVENDIILEIDGTKIDENQNFAYLIRDKKVGDTVTMKVLSKGIVKTVTLRLEAAPDNL